MHPPALLSLSLLLPTLALGAHNSPLDARHPSRHHAHAHAHARARSAFDHVAKKHMLREKQLARRGADPSTCRVRGAAYTPTTAAVSATGSAVSVSASAAASVAASVAASAAAASASASAVGGASPGASPSTTEAASAAAAAVSSDAQTSTNVDHQQNWADTSSTSSSAAAAATTKASSVAYSGLTPNGNKAGISAGDALPWLKEKIGWWYDWSATPYGDCANAVTVPMIWGAGTADSTDASRLAAFKSLSYTPSYVIGYEEPDCAAGSGSAGFDVETGIALWNSVVAPLGAAGSILVGPSMCKQAAESGWLGPFMAGVSRKPDIINIHVNKNSAAGINLDIDHYWNTYGLPMWVTEFACVDDSTDFIPCTDQTEINSFIYTAVGIFEADSRIAGYAFSNGYGLSDNWMMMKNGKLSESGQTYLSAISQYH